MAPVPEASGEAGDDPRALPWGLLALIAVALLIGLFVILRVAGQLITIMAPPGPPLPPTQALVEHTHFTHGGDSWLYQVAAGPCETLTFYAEQGGECEIAPLWCTELRADYAISSSSEELVGRCAGYQPLGAFGLRWSAEVYSARAGEAGSLLLVQRNILWSGAPATETTPLSELTPAAP